ncbi:MAG: dihydrofolate reductase family protein [Candidatus Marinimicrobia bacterium]|nr:dihydrofolate reductase family protein [Candidatus Neomarinimicrobiota bacterium]MCF7829148.1 dihydrofolate reductase family protein [Candidatus Neomarinimicrobiota bacterium]MCF7881199.1 dihydrofolate reductase family protein [Candidatus Neomarinimicrobiota bacterium]
MSKTILYIAMSLDGYIAGPEADLSWLDQFNDDETGLPDFDSEKEDNPYAWELFFRSVGAIIMGRSTYDWEISHGYGDVHPLPKFVLTHRPPDKDVREKVTFTDEPIGVVLEKAKSITDKHIWVEGGGIVAQQFIEEGLLDEMILFVAPVLLGGGIRLFGESDSYKNFRLRKVRPLSGGLVQLEYTPINRSIQLH